MFIGLCVYRILGLRDINVFGLLGYKNIVSLHSKLETYIFTVFHFPLLKTAMAIRARMDSLMEIPQ